MKRRVLILCTGNSCRSQMAEALWRHYGGRDWQADSAGSKPAGFVHPRAIEVMREIGLDLSGARSKHVDEFAGQDFDLVITVCDRARESCPVFPGAKQTLHWPFDDPAEASGTDEQITSAFRRVRDAVAERIRGYLGQAAA